MFDITTRQAKLIKLMSKKKNYVPTRYFADHLEVSERTIFNDISLLEELLGEYGVRIDRKPNQGIKLCGDLETSEQLIQKIIKKLKLEDVSGYSALYRRKLIAKWLLIENKTVTYQSLSMDLYISTSCLIKDLDQIRKFMDEEVNLISDVKGTRVEGTEIGIQKTIKRFAYYLIEQERHNFTITSYGRILEQLFSKGVIEQVSQSMKELVSVSAGNISEQYLKSLFISLLILTERSYRGNHLDELRDIQFEGKEYLTNYPLAVQICHNISSKLSFTFTELEHKYISNQLFAHRIEVKMNNSYIENLFNYDTKRIISDVSEAINIDLTDDKKLYNSIMYHIFPMVYRIKSGIDIVNPLIHEIKNNYGVLFRIIWYVMEDFEKKYDFKLTDNEVAFITIHFRVAIERKEQMSKILVVCQTGLVTSDLIINRMKKFLPSNIQFKLIAKPSLEEEDLSEVDFIISSVQLQNIDRPVLYVSPLVRDTDLLKIYSYYLKYSSTIRNKETNKLEPGILSPFLSSRYIFLNENITTKKDCLNKMIDLLEQDGVVDQSFGTTVFEREKLGSTLVQDWVAVPHGLQSSVNETKISIMTMKHPIKWNNESYVSLIILLAVANKDIVNIRKFLGHLYKIILKTENLEKNIQKLHDPNDLIALLERENQCIMT